ncbi:MAG: response regulator [Planctomycetes bacterium]|nr:response regulator [Planctomycetota bacterium]
MNPKTVILIADDEVHIRRCLEFVFKREGFETVLAENGEMALSMARQAKPDICFLDLQMPPMNGDEVCLKLREDPELARMHIVIITGRSQETDRQKILGAGVNEYLTKPFSPTKVVTRVREILAQRERNPEAH